ncbi:MAG TPA: DUF262 domain-containing protein [Allosphingosinicella sp.]|nr:DUF262 domain-containing protein [Allosphingosinicella sp.]
MDDTDEILEAELAEPLSSEIDDERASRRPSKDEEIEAQFGEQPFRAVYQTNNFFLPQIKDLIVDGDVLNIRPEYQRRLRWSDTQKSLLIESLLLNVPIPPLFFFESDLARYEVMDGQQRLNAIKEFLSGDFSLRGLTVLSALNGRRYTKLPPRIKRSLDRASVQAIVVLQESQTSLKKAGSHRFYELRRFVFERLNTGGRRLNAQEIRNAVYGSLFNNLVIELARGNTFTRIWGIPSFQAADPNEYYEDPERQKNSLYRTMGDCQIVLRFFALRDPKHIQGSIRRILDNCMERNLDLDTEQCAALGAAFNERLEFLDVLFDGAPFEAVLYGRKRPLVSIFDSMMVAVDRLWARKDELTAKKRKILKAYDVLLAKEGSTGRLTGSANTAQDIKDRIDLFEHMFIGELD